MSNVNPFRYQHEKMGAAISALMLPDAPFERRLLHAMNEFTLAFHHGVPSGSALTYYLKIKEVMGDGPYEQRARALNETQQHQIVTAFWELDRAVSRDYHTYELHQ